jgi:hypothetical protein
MRGAERHRDRDGDVGKRGAFGVRRQMLEHREASFELGSHGRLIVADR